MHSTRSPTTTPPLKENAISALKQPHPANAALKLAMARLSIPARAALATAAYFALSAGILLSFNLGLPPPLERVLSMLAAPALFLMAIWTPALRPLGLASGEWFMLPTLTGALLLIALYAALAYLAAVLVLRLFGRER